MHDYLSWSADDLDPHRLAAQTQVIRFVAMVAAKVGDEARLQRDRQCILAELSAKEFGAKTSIGLVRGKLRGSGGRVL
jgi:hypothetical protein